MMGFIYGKLEALTGFVFEGVGLIKIWKALCHFPVF